MPLAAMPDELYFRLSPLMPPLMPMNISLSIATARRFR